MNNAISKFSSAAMGSHGFAWMWLGQGGFAYRFDGTTVVIDPYLSDAVISLPRAYPREAEPCDIAGDLLLTTHGHDDHYDPETVEYAVRHAGMTVGGPHSCHLLYRERALPEDKFLEIKEGDRLEFRNITITAVHAQHSSSHGLADSVGYLISGAGVSIYHVGDCEYSDRILAQCREMKLDYLFVPINGKWSNMNAREAAQLAVGIGARAAIPMHHDMFLGNQEDPARLVNEVKALTNQCDVIIPVRWKTQSSGMSV